MSLQPEHYVSNMHSEIFIHGPEDAVQTLSRFEQASLTPEPGQRDVTAQTMNDTRKLTKKMLAIMAKWRDPKGLITYTGDCGGW